MNIRKASTFLIGLLALTIVLFWVTFNSIPFTEAHEPQRLAQTTNLYEITLSSDDGSEFHGNCAYADPNNEIYLGRCDGGNDITAGFRFTVTNINQGMNICSARVHFTTDGPYTNSLDLQIYGEDAANSATFSSSSRPSNRSTTTQYIDWQIDDNWTSGGSTQTPDI